MKIISAEERLGSDFGAKLMLLGESGIGKTSQLLTLDQEKTLFVNIEAGDLSVRNFKGVTLETETWQDCRDIAVLLGGPNMSITSENLSYGQAHYDNALKRFPNLKDINSTYDNLFVDSISVASRLCFSWCEQQPDAETKGGVPNTLKIYGKLKTELVQWATHLQHIKNKNVIFVGLLDTYKDDVTQKDSYQIQMDGSGAKLAIPGIVDEMISYVWKPVNNLDPEQPASKQRMFVCHTDNPWDYPCKDRSGLLSQIEEPHLGNLLNKITQKKLKGDK